MDYISVSVYANRECSFLCGGEKMTAFYYLLKSKSFLWMMLVVNVLGTIYGYYWYREQLQAAPLKFVLFIPDSPTACLFFVVVLIYFLRGKNNGLFESLAVVSLFKYGFWAIGMNIFFLVYNGYLPWTGYMLMASHFAMAMQGLVYAPFYRIKIWHIVVTALFTVHNEIIDYVYNMMPTYGTLNQFYQPIGYVTFWLSVLSIGIVYIIYKRQEYSGISIRVDLTE